MNTIHENISTVTQPPIFAVAGVTLFGVTLNEWIMLGTAFLLVLNIAVAGIKLISLWKGKRNGE